MNNASGKCVVVVSLYYICIVVQMLNVGVICAISCNVWSVFRTIIMNVDVDVISDSMVKVYYYNGIVIAL